MGQIVFITSVILMIVYVMTIIINMIDNRDSLEDYNVGMINNNKIGIVVVALWILSFGLFQIPNDKTQITYVEKVVAESNVYVCHVIVIHRNNVNMETQYENIFQSKCSDVDITKYFKIAG